MSNRTLSLLIFRGVLISGIMGYQLLALPFPFPRLSFSAIIQVCTCMTLVNLLYAVFLVHQQRHKRRPSTNFVFFQLTMDIVAVSALIYYTGGIASNLKFSYLIFILVSAIFLDKIAIYALTMVSLALYFFTLNLQLVFMTEPATTSWHWSEQVGHATLAQFVICFLTTLLSAFMQSSYRSGNESLREKDRHIRSLRRIRRKIVETLPSGLIICTPEGTIDFINQVGRRLLKIPADAELIKLNSWKLLDLDPDQKEPITIKNLVRTERRLTIEGVRKFMGISYTPMEHESGEKSIMIVFQDLTKIKMLEAHRSLNDRMTALGKVAASVAHEIRNPLAAISGSVQVLKELTPQDEAAKELAEIVENETQRLDRIISQFMAYAKPGPPPAFNPVSLEEVVRHFLRLAANDTRLKTLTLVGDMPEGESSLILADQGRLTQVLWNLTTNSYHASQPGDRVTIGCRARGEDVVLFVEDTGQGMTEDQVRDLFTPFQSFNKTGTGLGMSIVYDIIKTHQGKIDVRSHIGKGTHIEISFARYQE